MKFLRKIAQSRFAVPVCGALALLSLVYSAYAMQTILADDTVGSMHYLKTDPQTPDAEYIPEIPTAPETDEVLHVPTVETFTAREEIALPEASPSEQHTQAPITESEAVTVTPKPPQSTAQTQKPTNSTTKPVDSTQKPVESTKPQSQPVTAWSVTYAQAKGMVKSDSAYDAEDLYWLSRIISAEAKGESFTGQIGVGTVVLNRVRSSQFPNTIKGVVFDQTDGTQFTPVANGTIYDTPTQSAVVAAKMCLDGYTLSNSVLYFLNPRIATSSWIQNNRKYAFRVGNHDFYH